MTERPVTRMDRRRLHSREQLVTAATELLYEIGYHDLTIKAITERADLGYGTFYLHFRDKDDIVWEIIHAAAEQQRRLVDERIKDIAFPRREYLSWLMLFEFAAEAREGIVMLLGSQGSARLLQRYQDYLAKLYEDNLRQGKYSAGLDIPADFLGQFAAGATLRLLIWWLETPNVYSAEQMAGMIYQTVYRQPPPEG
jgi:AcrR family transcriptional regulator